MTRFLESCREAIANDEMDAPGAYTPPTQAEISASEEALEIEFPDDFLRFHAECDGHHLPFWEVLTLSGSARAGTHISWPSTGGSGGRLPTGSDCPSTWWRSTTMAP